MGADGGEGEKEMRESVKRKLASEIAKSNFSEALRAFDAGEYDSLDEAVSSYAGNAYDTAKELGYPLRVAELACNYVCCHHERYILSKENQF